VHSTVTANKNVDQGKTSAKIFPSGRKKHIKCCQEKNKCVVRKTRKKLNVASKKY
jgi:hypothetical protein